jgi:hypothetical protein
MIDIESLTLKEAREISRLFQPNNQPASPADSPYKIGEVYLVRTVTMIDTGRVVRVTPQEIVLTEAAWIADTGRFADALKKAEFSEVEPFPDGEVIINRAAVIDACVIQRAPRSQK